MLQLNIYYIEFLQIVSHSILLFVVSFFKERFKLLFFFIKKNTNTS
jgi:hypothetical protein